MLRQHCSRHQHAHCYAQQRKKARRRSPSCRDGSESGCCCGDDDDEPTRGDVPSCGDDEPSCGDEEPCCSDDEPSRGDGDDGGDGDGDGDGGDGPVVSPNDVAIDCAVDDSNDGGESQWPNDDLNDELSDGLSDGLGAVPSTCVADDALRLSTVASCTGFGRQQRTTVSELIGCGHSKSISASASSAAMAASSCGDETVANVGFGDTGDVAEWSSIVPGASSRGDRWIEPPLPCEMHSACCSSTEAIGVVAPDARAPRRSSPPRDASPNSDITFVLVVGPVSRYDFTKEKTH